MKTHTIDFKSQLTELGRELRGVITYNDVTLEEEINSITPHYNADILKSVMKQLDLELTVDIPLNTIINCQIGILVNGDYEMLNYGNYVVYNSEKQEDTGTYKITCYDKLLYSMKQNEDLGITYPITIKNYLIALGNKIGLSVANTTFYNQDMQIPSELYLGQEYTYRDILDEIAQATGSIICLNENDEIQVKYPTQTNDTIDEEYLKDVNVKFGERYGAINTIVLSRAGESDNVYYPDPLPANPIEIKIVDNQIMNFNNRSDYLEGIYNALNGLYYYINDFTSTGILYYDVGDLYNIQVGENTYQCLMLNDEINVTTGIEEIVYTDMPEQSETDYSKADKTDRKINQTYLIVDKQNQKIESVVSNVNSQNNKISQLTQTVDELNSRISDIADITTSGESMQASVQLSNINQSEPIELIVHPITQSISYLYPRSNLYPSSSLYLTTRTIRFIRTYDDNGTTRTQNIDYILPDDLLYYDSENYDEFILNYDSHTCQVRKKCKYNADGTVGLLSSEVVTDYTYPTIQLEDGDYQIKILNYNIGYLSVRLMAQNIYTTQFATKTEVTSEINQKADSITASVNQTFSNYSTTNQMNSAIQLKANEITSSVSETYATKTALNTVNSNLSSQITQTANQITSSVSNTYATKNQLNNYSTTTQMNSAINQKADSITSTVSSTYETKTNASNTYATKTQLNTAKSEIRQTTDSISATVSNNNTKANIIAKINNNTSSAKINADVISLSANDILNLLAGNTINLSSKNINIQSNNFKVSTDGILECWEAIFRNAKLMGGDLNFYKANGDLVGRIRRATSNFDGTSAEALVLSTLQSTTPTFFIYFHNSSGDLTGPPILSISQKSTSNFDNLSSSSGYVGFIEIRQVVQVSNLIVNTIQPYSGNTVNVSGYVRATGFVNNSKESLKKDIEKYNDIALEIIKESEIYQYHFQKEDDTDKKHLGFVIGDLGGEYKTPNEVISQDGEGIDTYNMTSILWKAFQEYIEKTDEKIAQLEQEIKELKGEK